MHIQNYENSHTNYINTFIEVAEDCAAAKAEIPPQKGNEKTAANIQFDLISQNPYLYSSDDVLFQVFAEKNNISEKEYTIAREKFFSKGQPCFRASPLTKRYGFGLHANQDGKIAIYGIETTEYQNFLIDNSIKKVKAMRSSKK